MAGAAIMVITQMPDRASALVLARSLVESRVAACVSVGAPVESLYHWRGKIETAQEVPVVVKTQPDAVSGGRGRDSGAAPYELPEIVAVPVVDGLAPYLQWIADETAKTWDERLPCLWRLCRIPIAGLLLRAFGLMSLSRIAWALAALPIVLLLAAVRPPRQRRQTEAARA